MNGNFFDRDGNPSDLDPFSERQVADRLRSALADHSDRFEPAPNSYLTLSKRLEEAVPEAPKRSWRGNGRVLAAAAMFVAAVGAGGYIISQAQTADLEAVGADSPEPEVEPIVTTTTTPATTLSTTSTTVATTTTPPPPEVVAAVVDVAAMPRTPDAADAAADFVHLLGLPGRARFTANGDSVDMFVPENLGSADVSLAQITVDSDDEGFVAARATSETMQISDVYVDGNELVVLGQGVSFEAHVEVWLIGADGTPLEFTHTTAGCCDDLVPFEARLSLRGKGEGFVLVNGDSAGSGVVPAFAAWPIRFDGQPDSTTYTVFRIRPDDSDKGLNLRDLPGTDEGLVLATLPPGETGIKRLPEMPALVGDSYWWHVQVADGTQGWANSAFLTADSSSLDDENLVNRAEITVVNLAIADNDLLEVFDLSRRVPVALGWIGKPYTAYGPDLLDIDDWLKAGRWAVPEATYGESEKTISLRSLLNLPEFSDEPQIVAGAAVNYAFEQEMIDSYFAGTRAVTVVGPDTGDEPARSTILFYEATPQGPQLVGIVVSIWIP